MEAFDRKFNYFGFELELLYNFFAYTTISENIFRKTKKKNYFNFTIIFFLHTSNLETKLLKKIFYDLS